MLKPNFKKCITAIIILTSIATLIYFITTKNTDNLTVLSDALIPTLSDVSAPNDKSIVGPSIPTVTSSFTPVLTNNLTLIGSQTYNLDITGRTDTSNQFQRMTNSLPSGSSIKLPKGNYKLLSTVKLKDNVTIIAPNDVIFTGIGNNTIFYTGNDNIFKGIEFQNCGTALSVFNKTGLKVINCNFTNNIRFSAINFYGSSDSSVLNSYFSGIRKYGILIDIDSSDITIDNNNFNNAEVFGGYKKEQIGGHVYCLNGTNIKVADNIF